jgi:hypothetical protein
LHGHKERVCRKATRRDEIERLLAEAERIFQEHGKNPMIQALGPLIVTPVEIHMGEEGKTPPRETSLEVDNSQPK